MHGRGGQGNVVAAYLLAGAAFVEGRFAQAFPAFGAERRGAPVTAFVRIAEHPIRRRCQVLEPAYLIVQDETLLHAGDITAGLLPGGAVLVNSTHSSEELSAQLGCDAVALPASALAQEILGRPVPNTALLSAFLELTGLLPRTALVTALGERFRGPVLDKNRALVERAAAAVSAGAWQEDTHAVRA
ncbi:MAG: 2-oxoacid:acceptor oxidoreductase family protein [Gammaproteobacteria bacterium]